MTILYIFEDKIIGIGLWLITQLFKVAAFSFKIFMLLAQNDVLKEIDYSKLITNFYVVLGIIMLFIMAFAILRGIVNPDDQKQGTTIVKNMIINFVLSCVILGFLPTIFPFMFDLQDSILRYNVIGGFFGYGRVGEILTDNTNVSDVEAGAYRLVNGVFTGFFNVSEGFCNNVLGQNSYKNRAQEIEECQKQLTTDSELVADGDDHDGTNNFYMFKEHVDETGDFSVYSAFIEQAADNNVSFNFIVLLIAGCALIYVGISYCFDMALRLIKLIFYQVLAPIPIFLRIIPNSKFSGTFNQWLKVTLTCWMEVFVRIFIFSFCMWLCTAIMSTNFLSSNIYEYGKMTGLFTKAFILMAIVMFMKRSPKLLSEITGIDSGNMKLGIREKLAEGGGLVAGAAVGGLATAGIREGVSTFRRTRANIDKLDKNSDDYKKQRAKVIAKGAGGGLLSVMNSASRGFFGGGKNAWGKKTYKDAGAAMNKAGADAVSATEEGRRYRANHGVLGWMSRPFVEGGRAVADYFNAGGIDNQKRSFLNASKQGRQSALDSLESWKSKKYAEDTKAQIEALKRETLSYDEQKAKLQELQTRRQEAERNHIPINMADLQKESELSNQVKQMDEKLKQKAELEKGLLGFEIQENMKRTHDIARMVSQASQSESIMHDPKISETWHNSILNEFGAEIGDNGKVLINGQDVSSTGTGKIISALMGNQAIDAEWIDEGNVHLLHEAMDKANIAAGDAIADFEKENYRPPRPGGSQSGGKGNS